MNSLSFWIIYFLMIMCCLALYAGHHKWYRYMTVGVILGIIPVFNCIFFMYLFINFLNKKGIK